LPKVNVENSVDDGIESRVDITEPSQKLEKTIAIGENGNQQMLKAPMIIPRVLAARRSRVNEIFCRCFRVVPELAGLRIHVELKTWLCRSLSEPAIKSVRLLFSASLSSSLPKLTVLMPIETLFTK
ncbi:hypothetical protein BpHYR1_019632, partial [Brachionus plicatilis]